MDRNIPPAAVLLLDFIGDIEAPRGYGTIFANKQHKLKKPLVTMTLDEVIVAQKGWSKDHGSSAAGRYQFMRATLLDLMKELGLRGSQHFDANLQDRLGFHLLIRRGYNSFVAGTIDRNEFGKRLAMEWASLPVLTTTTGAHRNLPRGASYYAGDKLNKSLVSAAEVEAILSQVRSLQWEVRITPADLHVEPEPAPVQFPPAPPPVIVQGGFWNWLKGLFA